MYRFLQLNRHKLKFAFKATSFLFVALVSIAFTLVFINGQVPDLTLLITVFLFAGVVFPLFTLFISYLAWYYKQWAKSKVFSKAPFDQLHELGFSDKLQAEKTKWAFTEEVKGGKINGFDVIADVLYDKRHMIEVRVYPAWKRLDRDEYKSLTRELKAQDIEFDIGCLVKQYNTKRLSMLTIDDLKRDLEELTELLKRNGFEPQTQHGLA
jgi:hypothetical protein